MNTDGTANDTVILGAMAQAALVKLGTPAAPVDRPGDWGDRPILTRFGASAVDELIAAGLVQRGGTPSSVPPAVEARYPQNMRLHREQLRTIAGRGDLPPYPAPRDILFMTASGWIALEELTARGVPDDRAIDEFALALKEKMAEGRTRGRGGWQTCPLPALQSLLRESVEKGDPRDVATYAMMIWHHERLQMWPDQGEAIGLEACDQENADPHQHRCVLSSLADHGLFMIQMHMSSQERAGPGAGVSDDRAIDEFAIALKEKMAEGRARGRGGWQTCPLAALQSLLRESVEKGDPRDVATYAMMIWHHERLQMWPWRAEDIGEAVSLDFAPPGPGVGRRDDAKALDRLASTPATTDIGGSHE